MTLEIIQRETWGSAYRDGVGNRSIGDLEKFLHHSVTAHLSEDALFAHECAQMRVIEQIGQQRFKAGMSYTFVGFPSGRIYEGVTINRISYHSGGGRNTRGAGICLAGNYQKYRLGNKLINSLAELLVLGVQQSWWKHAKIDAGHRDFKSTSCPGKFAYAEIGTINSRAYVLSKGGGGGGQTGGDDGVRAQMKILASGGFYKGAIDGVPGPMFHQAVRDYQANQEYPDLVVDGYWGPYTDRHAHWVLGLQQALNEWSARWASNLNPLREDWDYGLLTKQRVLDWQVRNQGEGRAYPPYAALDGLAGPITTKGMGYRQHP